jgi:hypothetical protein
LLAGTGFRWLPLVDLYVIDSIVIFNDGSGEPGRWRQGLRRRLWWFRCKNCNYWL